jgi:lysophospholipase L1-like esterase
MNSDSRLSASSQSFLPGAASLGLIPLLLAADTLIAVARGWRTESRVEVGLIAVFFALAGLACVMIALPGGRRLLSNPRVSFQILTWSLMVAASLTLGDVALRVLVEPGKAVQHHKRDANMSWVFTPNPEFMAGISGESHFTTNSDGVRAPAWPARDKAYRILCVGGSTTECIYLDDNETWPALVMQTLNGRDPAHPAWVGNIGISGYGAADHLKFVERSDLMPQIDCVVFLCGINDLQHTLRDPEAMNKIAPFWQRTSIWHFILDGYVAMRRKMGFVPSLFEDKTGSNYQIRRQVRASAKACDQLPDLTQPLAEYRRRVENIVKTCRARGVRPVFVKQPMLWRSGLSPRTLSSMWLGMLQDDSFLTVERLREGIDSFNQVLQKTCASLDVECIDTSALDGREEYYYDETHFNETGAHKLAEIVSDWLLAHPPAAPRS